MQVVGAPTACAPEPWATPASPASAAARVAALGVWRRGRERTHARGFPRRKLMKRARLPRLLPSCGGEEKTSGKISLPTLYIHPPARSTALLDFRSEPTETQAIASCRCRMTKLSSACRPPRTYCGLREGEASLDVRACLFFPTLFSFMACPRRQTGEPSLSRGILGSDTFRDTLGEC